MVLAVAGRVEDLVQILQVDAAVIQVHVPAEHVEQLGDGPGFVPTPPRTGVDGLVGAGVLEEKGLEGLGGHDVGDEELADDVRCRC